MIKLEAARTSDREPARMSLISPVFHDGRCSAKAHQRKPPYCAQLRDVVGMNPVVKRGFEIRSYWRIASDPSHELATSAARVVGRAIKTKQQRLSPLRGLRTWLPRSFCSNTRRVAEVISVFDMQSVLRQKGGLGTPP